MYWYTNQFQSTASANRRQYLQQAKHIQIYNDFYTASLMIQKKFSQLQVKSSMIHAGFKHTHSQ